MVLIADSGSTKCDWIVYDDKYRKTSQVRTKGINPLILLDGEIRLILQQLTKEIHVEITKIQFYCAGGSHENSRYRLNALLKEYFPYAQISIEDDLGLAIKATGSTSGVICILGTGSNSCFFDGPEVHKRLPDLGYQVMDEGSGNYYGRELLRSYAYGYMPAELANSFQNQYELGTDAILHELYKGKNTSSYLASFSQFLIQNKEHDFMKNLIDEGVNKVFEHVLAPYSVELEHHSLYFIGSIAFFLQKAIERKAYENGYSKVFFIRRPIENIIIDLQIKKEAYKS